MTLLVGVDPQGGCTADRRCSQEWRPRCPGKDPARVGLSLNSRASISHGKAEEEDFYQMVKHNSQGSFCPLDPKPLCSAQAPQ